MLSNRTASSKCGAHCCAEPVKISTVGSIQDVSSTVAAFRKARPGIDPVVLNIGDPRANRPLGGAGVALADGLG
jgi:hypothetical protein